MAGTAPRVLMLHGHGQSAEIFYPKTRRLRKAFQDASDEAPFDFEFLSGVWPAYPDREDRDWYRVWGYGEEADRIRGLARSLEYIQDTLERKGPFIGIVGFSSGAAMAALVTSILEKREPMCGLSRKTSHSPFQFTICLSGFKLQNSYYEGFYRTKILTPSLHVSGSLDAVITPEQTKSLASHFHNVQLFEFFRGHYVPQSKEFCAALTKFLKENLKPNAH
ncbi:uncharacterized protein N7496_006104 [Penicillium cataractarum]|uniref:Serine hydrolase domain-containing protein n=1 Tax=Penicillium cataractarum TaxID=2100454 RepID=A0A9W9S0W8_9EURO|nr:uncharacterized protein N7496_006104 [Penicillium cataractarum]KAJ5370012.1 hypothetical protein N7496_006104 [Penicillium cataractarum]